MLFPYLKKQNESIALGYVCFRLLEAVIIVAGTVAMLSFVAVEPRRRIEVEDGFAHEDGRPNEEMPTMRMVFTFEQTSTGSRFTGVTAFPSLEAMERLVEMGMVEGMQSALGQMDAVLADLPSFAAGRATGTQILNDA